MLDTNNFRELADARLGEGFDIIEMKRVMLTASMCIHHQSSRRPYMNRVWNCVFLFNVTLFFHIPKFDRLCSPFLFFFLLYIGCSAVES